MNIDKLEREYDENNRYFTLYLVKIFSLLMSLLVVFSLLHE